MSSVYSWADCYSTVYTHKFIIDTYFQDSLDAEHILPDVFVDPVTGANLDIPRISWQSLEDATQYGPVMVGGQFIVKETGEVVEHLSLLVGVNPDGTRIWNDPFFNPDNTNSLYKISNNDLEKYIEVIPTNALIITTTSP